MMMVRYQDKSHRSGVRAYKIGADNIRVQFADGTVYNYTHVTPGKTKVEHMKRLALRGKGLCTFISQHVGADYDSKN